ncbi:helix-turn-helix domain-containing protein [Vibrio splendidus]|uniref:helix-turn-helix domain-containing protein n=1 Tax=Vibrio splendidus TaxID=29497 RepID=UPI001F51AFF1|nr:helix-turn-helix transcriptional regulator [Vibrio splendidus]
MMKLILKLRRLPWFKCTAIAVVRSSVELGKKIKAIRIAEKLNQEEMSQLIDISIGAQRDYEQERRIPKGDFLMKITKHERFKKYAYWLVTDETLPESGQISPDFSILLELGIVEKVTSDKKLA